MSQWKCWSCDDEMQFLETFSQVQRDNLSGYVTTPCQASKISKTAWRLRFTLQLPYSNCPARWCHPLRYSCSLVERAGSHSQGNIWTILNIVVLLSNEISTSSSWPAAWHRRNICELNGKGLFNQSIIRQIGQSIHYVLVVFRLINYIDNWLIVARFQALD